MLPNVARVIGNGENDRGIAIHVISAAINAVIGLMINLVVPWLSSVINVFQFIQQFAKAGVKSPL